MNLIAQLMEVDRFGERARLACTGRRRADQIECTKCAPLGSMPGRQMPSARRQCLRPQRSLSHFSTSFRLRLSCASAQIIASLSVALWAMATDAAPVRVTAVPESVRREFNLATFYQKHVDVAGLPVVSSTNVSDYALLEAAWIVRQMLTNRADILQALASNHVRLAVMAYDEFTTDIPEHSTLKPKVYWDRRARGLGATQSRPAVSCAEENLLCFPGDPYAAENILVHEFAHAVHEMSMTAIDPSFDLRLRSAFESAKKTGLWKGTYAGSNRSEYWAEGSQSWFDDNRENDASHNHVNTRAELIAYDPDLAKLCAEIYGNIPWRYQKPFRRAAPDRAYLAGYDPSNAPHFKWRVAPIPEQPKVMIQTELGDIEVILEARRAQATVKNFLRYTAEGLYSDGLFHRTVTLQNQPSNSVKIEVIQASANPSRTNDFFPPIPIERTRDTGLKHLDGTVSMARGEPNTAQDHFFICLGDQPGLDFGGKRNPDGQGFAAFGRVSKGMDVVRKIHASTASGQQLTPAIRIQLVVRLE